MSDGSSSLVITPEKSGEPNEIRPAELMDLAKSLYLEEKAGNHTEMFQALIGRWTKDALFGIVATRQHTPVGYMLFKRASDTTLHCVCLTSNLSGQDDVRVDLVSVAKQYPASSAQQILVSICETEDDQAKFLKDTGWKCVKLIRGTEGARDSYLFRLALGGKQGGWH